MFSFAAVTCNIPTAGNAQVSRLTKGKGEGRLGGDGQRRTDTTTQDLSVTVTVFGSQLKNNCGVALTYSDTSFGFKVNTCEKDSAGIRMDLGLLE